MAICSIRVVYVFRLPTLISSYSSYSNYTVLTVLEQPRCSNSIIICQKRLCHDINVYHDEYESNEITATM